MIAQTKTSPADLAQKKKNRVKIGKKTPGRSLLLRRDPSLLGVLGSLEILGPSIRRSPLSLEIDHRPLLPLLLSDFPEIEPRTPPCLRRDCSPTKSSKVKVSFPPFPLFLPLLFVFLCAAAGDESRQFLVGERDLYFGLFSVDFFSTENSHRLTVDRSSSKRSAPIRIRLAVIYFPLHKYHLLNTIRGIKG